MENKKFLAIDGQIYSTNPNNPLVVEAADIYDDTLQKTLALINAETSSSLNALRNINTATSNALDAQSTKNTQIENSISALAELKLNKLVAGSNITIAGNVISAITGGDRSETPIVLYKWIATIPLAPAITALDYVNSTNLDGWSPTAPSKVTDTYLWMTQNTLVYENSSFSLKDNWSTPVQLSGDKGDTGTKGDKGDQGDKGDKGDPGEDATNREFIYKRLTEYPFNSTNPASINRDSENIERTAEYIASTDDFVPYGWSDTAIPATDSEKYVYIAIRTKASGTNQTWGAFSTPVLWSNWGQTGMDGDGVLYVYKLFDHELTNEELTSNIPLKPQSMINGEWVPSGWSDDPLAPRPDAKFCYCSVIKKISGEWENSFGKLGLWSKWANDGSSVVAEYSTTGGVGTWHSSFTLGDVWMRTSSDGGTTWTSGMRIIGEKGDETNFQFAISLYLVSNVQNGAPSDIITWSNTPVATEPNKPYLWAKITTPNGTTTYVRLTGEVGPSGKDAIFADLTNEMDSVACNSEGRVTSEQFVETYTGIYKGSSRQILTNIVCTIGNTVLGSTYSNDSSSIAYYYKIVVDNTTGYVKVIVRENTIIQSRTDVSITLTSIIDGVSTSRELTLTINGVRGGANGSPAIIYSLVPSTTKIVKKKNGSFIPNGNITCQINKTQGTSVPEIVLADLTTIKLFKKVNNGLEEAYSATASNTITSGIEFYLYINDGTDDILVDKESIPLIEDGVDGIPDTWTIGADGYWYKNGVKYTDVNYPNGIKAEAHDGTGIELKGTVDYALVSELPDPNPDGKTALPAKNSSGLEVGDCYMVKDNGWLYFYDGETAAAQASGNTPASPEGWVPIGEIRGEAGISGTTYYYHIAWATSITYDSVSGELSSCTGFTTDKGNVDYPWMGICVDAVYDDPGSLERPVVDAYKSYAWNKIEGIQGLPGENGDTMATLFKWFSENAQISTPPSNSELSAAQYVAGTNLDGWSKFAPNRQSSGLHLWMSLRILKKTVGGEYLWETGTTWSTPIRISGDTGIPGEDGDTREWIYSYDNSVQPSTISTGHIGGSASGNVTNKNQPDWIPNGWSDNPQGVSSYNKTEYAAYRDITHNGTTVTYGLFSDYIVWSHWGERGIDGDGIEYVYIRTKDDINAPVVPDTGDYAESNYNVDDHKPYVRVPDTSDLYGYGSTITSGSFKYALCTDEPVGIDNDWKCEWVLKRTKTDANANGERTWKPYSGAMTIWSKEGPQGVSITDYNEYYLASSSAAGITTSSSGWTTDMAAEAAKMTASIRFLWYYSRTTFSDGRNPKIIGPAIKLVWGLGGAVKVNLSYNNKTKSWWDSLISNSLTQTWEGTASNRADCIIGDFFTVTGTTTDTGDSYSLTYICLNDPENLLGVAQDLQGQLFSYNITKAGKAGKGISSTEIRYNVSSSGTSAPNDANWSPSIPTTTQEYPFLWTRIITYYTDGNSSTSYMVARSGFNGISVSVLYSEDNTHWHDNYGSNDLYMRTNTGGSWGNGMRIVGEKGDGGNYIDYSFDISAKPSTSTVQTKPADTRAAESWDDNPIATTSNKPYLWMQMVQHTISNGTDTAGSAHYIRLTPSDGVTYFFTCDWSKIVIPSGSTSKSFSTTISLWSKTSENEPTNASFYIYPYYRDTSNGVHWIDHSSEASSSFTYSNYNVTDSMSYLGVVAFSAFITNNNASSKLSSGEYLAKFEIPVEKEVLTKNDLENLSEFVIGKYNNVNVISLSPNTGQLTFNAPSINCTGSLSVGGLSVVTASDSGKIPSSYLPSYVDDILEYAGVSNFPSTGETGKIYVALDTNSIYRWSGSQYVEVSPLAGAPVSSVNGKTGSVVINAYDVGLGNVGNYKAVSTVANLSLSSTELSNARANIGAGTSSFSGNYNDLTNKPALGINAFENKTKLSEFTNDVGFTSNPSPGNISCDNSTSLAVTASESLSGTINLNRIAKTASYKHLVDLPQGYFTNFIAFDDDGGYMDSGYNQDSFVRTVSGKGLSTNDFTTAYKNKLDGIDSGATNLTIGTTSSTACAGNVGLYAYNHAADSGKISNAVLGGLYKIAVTSEGHIASASVVTKSDITSLGIPGLDTTYLIATQSASGLMSYLDKSKLDGIAYGATANTGTVTNISVGAGLKLDSGGSLTTSGTISPNLSSTSSLGSIGTTDRLYAVGIDNANRLCVSVPWTDSNTTYGEATTSSSGLMSASDKNKLNSIAFGATANSAPGQLVTDNEIALETVAGESMANNINLHRIAKTGSYNHLLNKPDLSIYAQSSSLSTVATSGNYNDLSNKPNLSGYLRYSGSSSGTFLNLVAFDDAGGLMDSGYNQDSFVRTVSGKGLSTNDFTTTYKDKLDSAYGHAADPNKISNAAFSKLYKIAVTSEGHIASAAPVTKSDITDLGIPGQDTIYLNATTDAAGLMSAADKTKLDNVGITKTTTNSITTTKIAASSGQILELNAGGEVKLSSQSRPTISFTGQSAGNHGIATISDITSEINNLGYAKNSSGALTITSNSGNDPYISISSPYVELNGSTDGVFLLGGAVTNNLANVYIGGTDTDANKVATKGYVDTATANITAAKVAANGNSYTVSVVSSLPANPDDWTIYFITQ